jgi:hypothetical protein
MENNTDKKIERIASKLKIRDKAQRLEAARQINQLALLLIELRKNNENTHLHTSIH